MFERTTSTATGSASATGTDTEVSSLSAHNTRYWDGSAWTES